MKLETLIEELYGGNIAQSEKRKQEQFPKGIQRCGADALLFTLTSLLSAGNTAIDLNPNDIISKNYFVKRYGMEQN